MKKIMVLVAVAIMAFSVTGCNNNSKNNVSQSEAEKAALEKSGGGEIVRSNLDKDSEGDTFEFEIVNGDYKFEIDVDAATGKVINFDKESLGGNSSNNNNTDNSTITIEKAREAALAKSEGGEIVNEKQETDDGIPVFEFEIVNGDFKIDITVNANDGSIMSFEKEANTLLD